MIAKAELEALIASLLEGSDVELVEVQVVPGGRQHQLRVFLDRPGGIDIAACARVSREIARALAPRADVDRYRLEVSSPGMQRPIWTLEHFRRFAGERVQFELREPRGERVHFRGTIAAVADPWVVLRTEEGEEFRVTVDEIARARLDLDPWKRRRGPGGEERAG